MEITKPRYDLESRCLLFAKNTHTLVKSLPKSIGNIEYSKQLVRSSASVGANYIEANERLSKKDFLHRVRIAKKEARETRYWLRLLDPPHATINLRQDLINESTELMHILGSIIEKVKYN